MITIGCDIGKNYFDIFLDGKYLKFENNNKGISKYILKLVEGSLSI